MGTIACPASGAIATSTRTNTTTSIRTQSIFGTASVNGIAIEVLSGCGSDMAWTRYLAGCLARWLARYLARWHAPWLAASLATWLAASLPGYLPRSLPILYYDYHYNDYDDYNHYNHYNRIVHCDGSGGGNVAIAMKHAFRNNTQDAGCCRIIYNSWVGFGHEGLKYLNVGFPD